MDHFDTFEKLLNLIFTLLTFTFSESHNKIKKYNREYHTAKISRLDTMKQWTYRSIDGSDPLVLEESSADRLKHRKTHKIEDYPQIIQDMIIKDHPYNIFFRQLK